MRLTRFKGHAQGLACAQQVLLTYDLVNRCWTQALGQWDSAHRLLLKYVGALGHHKTKLVGGEGRIFFEASK